MSQSVHPDKSQNELESKKLQVQFDSGTIWGISEHFLQVGIGKPSQYRSLDFCKCRDVTCVLSEGSYAFGSSVGEVLQRT
ncbi:hypothetical protein SESBI_08512 [Sesbania bispinosa]|nr:hypothetical protein SESBI_08512 [Sesbania bispinosa]